MPPWLCKQPGGVLGGGGVAGGDVVVGDELLKATKVARALMMMKTADSQEGGRETITGGGRRACGSCCLARGQRLRQPKRHRHPNPPSKTCAVSVNVA